MESVVTTVVAEEISNTGLQTLFLPEVMGTMGGSDRAHEHDLLGRWKRW